MDSQRVPSSYRGTQSLDTQKPKESSGLSVAYPPPPLPPWPVTGPWTLIFLLNQARAADDSGRDYLKVAGPAPLFPNYLLSLPTNYHHPGSTPS